MKGQPGWSRSGGICFAEERAEGVRRLWGSLCALRREGTVSQFVSESARLYGENFLAPLEFDISVLPSSAINAE